MKDERLTPNFKLSEFVNLKAPPPPEAVLGNIRHLALRLQTIRDALKKPIIITSGYRSPEHNAQVAGSAKNSYHLWGMAADIQVVGMSPKAVQAFLADWPGGLGGYITHTHVDMRPYKARW
jgi:uncharacterized protein YcbK (DUF882 family)